MAGASAAASARQRRSKQISKKDSIEIDSTYNRSDERLHAISSLFGQSDNDIDGSLRSLTPNRRSLLSKTKSRRDVTKIPTPRDDNDQHNNSSFVSCAIELNEANEGIEMNSPHAKEDESFNENDDASNANSSKLPSWFICINNGRKYIGKRVNDPRVQTFILVLILINSLMMGIATFPFVKDNPETSEKFDIADQIFLVIFTVESGLQLLYYGWYLFTDSFLVFDLLIVIMSWALEGTQVIRAFRIFRALRLITRVEVMRNLVMALFDVIPKMTAIAMLLTLIFFIFGVMMTQLFKDMYPQTLSQPYFESLWNTLFTLFQMMTLVSAIFSVRYMKFSNYSNFLAHHIHSSSLDRMSGQTFWLKCKRFTPGHGPHSSFLSLLLGSWL